MKVRVLVWAVVCLFCAAVPLLAQEQAYQDRRSIHHVRQARRVRAECRACH